MLTRRLVCGTAHDISRVDQIAKARLMKRWKPGVRIPSGYRWQPHCVGNRDDARNPSRVLLYRDVLRGTESVTPFTPLTFV